MFVVKNGLLRGDESKHQNPHKVLTKIKKSAQTRINKGTEERFESRPEYIFEARKNKRFAGFFVDK